mmetsp:Transcript_2864/g.6419  ORF Transcript_2864/g.6419 Transcript_2864/m.6419 type:complete len:215 (-) Transcript_2864:225-869(-)
MQRINQSSDITLQSGPGRALFLIFASDLVDVVRRWVKNLGLGSWDCKSKWYIFTHKVELQTSDPAPRKLQATTEQDPRERSIDTYDNRSNRNVFIAPIAKATLWAPPGACLLLAHGAPIGTLLPERGRASSRIAWASARTGDSRRLIGRGRRNRLAVARSQLGSERAVEHSTHALVRLLARPVRAWQRSGSPPRRLRGSVARRQSRRCSPTSLA